MLLRPHLHRLRLEREARELRFAAEVKIDATQFDPESQKKLAEQTDAQENVVKTPEQRAEESAKAANDAIAKHNAFASKMTPDMAARLRDEVGGFMRTTVESFDRNGTEGLSVEEYDAYKANVESQIDQMFQSMGSSAEQVEKQATQQAEAEGQKAEQSAGNSEFMGKTIEEIEAMLQQPLEAFKGLTEINLETADAETLQQQLSLYQENVQAVQLAQEAIQQRGAIASSFHAKATEQMKTMSAEAETASASAAVAAGAATGAAIGVWGFGIGAFVGAGLGAAAGAIAYGIGRGLAAAALHAEKQKIADRVNAAVTRERTAIAAAREQVGGADGMGKLAAQGEQVNATPEALRIRTDEKTAGETAEIQSLADRTQGDQRETETKLGELENAIDSTEQADSKIDAAIATASASDNPEQRSAVDELRAKRDEIGDARMQMEDAREALSLRLGDFSEFIGQLQSTEEGVRISNGEEHARLDDLDLQLGGDVLVANVRTAQFQEQLGEDGARLAELPNIEPEAFFSGKTWSAGFDGFAAGVRFAIHEGIVPLIDAASASLKEIPVVGSLGYGLDVVSGVMEGVGDLGEGVATMLGHPVQTATGLATALGTAEGWRQIGGAMISYDDFAKGNVGKGIGKLGLNILMTATGVGAAAKGAQAARIGFVASRAAGAGVLRSSAKAAWIGVRVGSIELAQGTAKIPGNVAAGARNLGRGLKNLASSRLTAATNTIASVSDDIAKSTTALASFDDVAKLVGDNADDIAKLGAKELAALGIADAKSIGRFLRYRDLVKQNAVLQRSLDAAKVTQMLERAGPGLSKVQSMGEQLARARASGNASKAERILAKMRAVVDRANRRAGNVAGDVGHIIHNADGYMVAVGKSGRVELLAEAADVTRWIEDIAAYQGINPDILRVQVAEKILGRTLNDAQQIAMLEAHKVEGFGTLEDGGITRGNLRDKVDAMKKLFTKDERRLLMERGVTGTSTKKAPPEPIPLDDVDVLDDASVLDDVAKRADAAESSVKMSSDATIVEDRFTPLDPDTLQKGKKYSLSKDGRGWEFDSVDPDTGRLIFKRGDEVKTFNPKKLKVDGTLKTPSAAPQSVVRSAPRKGARATWKEVYGRYVAEQGSNPVASAIGASFEPEFLEAGLKSAYMRGTDALSKVPSATRKAVSSVRSYFTRTRARPTVSRTAADPLAVESFRTKKPALSDRYAFALESREGSWIGKRAGAALDVARGKDFLKQQFRAFEKGRKELLSLRKQMQAIEAKLQKNPTAARARQLREKLSTLSERREALRKDVRAARMDVRPEYVKTTVPIKSLPDAERIPLIDAAAQRLTETYTFGGKEYVFFGIDGKTGLAIFTDASDEAYRVTFTKRQLQAVAAKSPDLESLLAKIQLKRFTLTPGQRRALEIRAQHKMSTLPHPNAPAAAPAASAPTATPSVQPAANPSAAPTVAPASASAPSSAPSAPQKTMPPSPGRPSVAPNTAKPATAPAAEPMPAAPSARNVAPQNTPITRQEVVSAQGILTGSEADGVLRYLGPSSKRPGMGVARVENVSNPGRLIEIPIDRLSTATRLTTSPSPLRSVVDLPSTIRKEYLRYIHNPETQFGRLSNLRTSGMLWWKKFEFDNIDGQVVQYSAHDVVQILDEAPPFIEASFIDDILQRNKGISAADRSIMQARRAELERFF